MADRKMRLQSSKVFKLQQERRLMDREMAKLLGLTVNGYRKKVDNDTFSVNDAKILCKFFGKTFEELF